MTSANRSMVHSSTVAFPPTPALLTSTSIRPASAWILATAAFTDSVSVTSHTTGWTVTPAASAIVVSFAPLSRDRIVP